MSKYPALRTLIVAVLWIAAPVLTSIAVWHSASPDKDWVSVILIVWAFWSAITAIVIDW